MLFVLFTIVTTGVSLPCGVGTLFGVTIGAPVGGLFAGVLGGIPIGNLPKCDLAGSMCGRLSGTLIGIRILCDGRRCGGGGLRIEMFGLTKR